MYQSVQFVCNFHGMQYNAIRGWDGEMFNWNSDL
jgi:hypothetical protein